MDVIKCSLCSFPMTYYKKEDSAVCINSGCKRFNTKVVVIGATTKPTSRNPAYVSLIHKMLEIHEIKSHDYADDSNPFSNFEFAAQVAKGFNDEVDKVFATLIGVKLARLQQLLNGKSPKNESIDDTFLDLANYSAIWASYRMKR